MRRAVLVGTVIVALAFLALIAWHDAVVLAAVRAAVGSFGYQLDAGRVRANLSQLSATDVHITNHSGEPVLDVARLDIGYSLRDLLPGSRRRFGLTAVDVERPQLTLIHHADGTYNVSLPAGTQAPKKPDTTPIDVRIRVRDGSAALIDRFTVPDRERRQRIVGFALDANLSPHGHAFYDARFDLDDGRTRHPVTGHATFATARGYEAQRWHAPLLPIGPLVDFALPSHAINVVDGELHDLDARIYTFVRDDGSTHTHIGATTNLEHGKIYVASLAKPLRDVRGPIVAYDNGITTHGVDATLAGVPLQLVGGVFVHDGAQVRFSLTGSGTLAALRTIVPGQANRPIAGDLRFAFRAEGPATLPLVLGTFDAPSISDGTLRADRPAATIAYQDGKVDVLRAALGYGPFALVARGGVELQPVLHTDLVAFVHAAGDRVPYVGQLVRGLDLHAIAHVAGDKTKLATDGVVWGDAPDGGLAGLVRIDGDGNGVAGPIALDRHDGASLYLRVALDRAHGNVSAIASARDFSLLAPIATTALPGVNAASLPPVAGRLDAALAGAVDGNTLRALAGHVRVRGLAVGSVRGDLAADVAPADDGTQAVRLAARTSLGALAANGRIAGSAYVLDGHATRERIDVPLRIAGDGPTLAAQIDGARFGGLRVAGVRLDGADATVRVHDGTTDLVAARVGLDGSHVVARGRVLPQADLVAISGVLGLRPLGTAAFPIDDGHALAFAHVRGSLAEPRATLALVAGNVRARGLTADASANATYARGNLHLDDAHAVVAGATAQAAGDIRGLMTRRPSVNLHADVRGAQLADLDRIVRLPVRYPDGELDVTAHVTGDARSPHLAADVDLPNGSVNGLAFRDAHVGLDGGLDRLAVRDGHVSVGSTTVAFDGDLGRALQRIALRAPHVDLADFDDYFPTAETLAGRGALTVHASAGANAVASDGTVHLTGVRYRRFEIGTTDARWSTRGRTLQANATVAGTHGRIALASTATFPATAPLHDAAHRVVFRATGDVAAFDLAAWLPAAGLTLPVAGVLDASASANGAFANPSFAVRAAVTDGIVAGYHLTAATLTASGDRRVAHVQAVHVAGPGLVADLSGSAGYRPTDPIALALHAQSDDLLALERAAGVKLAAGGSASTDLRATGTRSAPRLAQTLDVRDLTYQKIRIDRIHGDLAADRRTLRVNALDADVARGHLAATAIVPVQLAPPAAGLRNAPLSAAVRIDGIDLGTFSDVLPAHSVLAGTLGGNVTAGGTPQSPTIDGTLSLAGGSYRSDLVRSPLTNVRATLAFTRNRAQLSELHADIGGGALDGSGTAQFGDLRRLQRTLGLDVQLTAKNARVAINPYLSRATIDGTVTATKAPADRAVTIGGAVTFAQTRIPPTALIPPSQPQATVTPRPLPVAFALGVIAGNDVRVQGAGIDVGARGAVRVGGTLAAPTLAGELVSTDGTLNFYRTFVLQSGTVAFDEADGLIPTVDATATTSISNPSTDILLQVSGPATHLNLTFASNPTYSREQILGLLVNAQALGAVSGVQVAQNGGGSGFNAADFAGGYLSGELTQNLLQPLGSQLGQSLGFSDLALGYSYGNGFSAGATRSLGKHLSATFHQTFGADQRQILGFQYALRDDASVQLSFFNAGNLSPNLVTTGNFLSSQDPFTPANYTLQALQPPPGVAGLVLTYQRKFWTGRIER